MSKARLNVNESEKQRIIKLHKNYSTIKEQDIDASDIDIMSPDSEYPSNVLDDKPNLQDTKPKPKPKQAAPAGCNDPDWVNLPMGGTAGQPNYSGGKNNYCDRCAANNTSPSFPIVFINGIFHYEPTNGVNYCFCCTPQNTEHECVNGNCVQQVGGQYPDLATCQQNCGQQGITHYCIDCANQVMSTYILGQGQCPGGMLDLGPNMPNQGPCIDCQQGNCNPTGWNGQYNSMQDCTQQCQQTGFDCVNNSCAQTPGGPFPTLADCQNSGCGQQTSYNCTNWYDPNGCQAVGGPGGQFATLDECLGSPCQCDQHIANWPLYLNNPNYDSNVNWWTGNDGPSNMNAVANQLSNVQSSNAYLTNDPTNPHYQKMKCREAALLMWQANGSNVACCSDPGFAVGAATSDPLGCVAQALINNSENANTQGFGCQWFCNVLANKHNQLAGTQSPVAQCKHTGAINFLTGYMTTGQSAYLNVPASFNGVCPNIPNGPGQNNIC